MARTDFTACAAIATVAIALIALIWIITDRVVQEQQVEVRNHAELALIAQAATIAETVGHELLMIDQSLTILQAAWKLDSNSVDLTKWQAVMPALTTVTDDLFIADEQRVIRQDILPGAVGQGIGSAYLAFPHGSQEQFRSDGSKTGEALPEQRDVGVPVEARQLLTYVIRPLDHPAGWVIGASYRSEALTRLFAKAALGYNAVIALVDTNRGVVQSIVGPASRRPRIDISKSLLFAALSRTPSGSWVGETPVDGMLRMHAFQRVANRDMAIVVAANWPEVMAVADNLAAGAYSLAALASAFVLLIASIVLWEVHSIRDNKQRKRVFDRTRSEIARLRREEAVLTAHAQLSAARLNVLLDSFSAGVAIFGPCLYLVLWNQPFSRGIGVGIRQDMPLADLFRAQAGVGLFGHVADCEIEIARRVAVLQASDIGTVAQFGPDGEPWILRGLPITGGGVMLILNRPQGAVPGVAALEAEELMTLVPTAAASPVEW